jgi:hypothetical protein
MKIDETRRCALKLQADFIEAFEGASGDLDVQLKYVGGIHLEVDATLVNCAGNFTVKVPKNPENDPLCLEINGRRVAAYWDQAALLEKFKSWASQ